MRSPPPPQGLQFAGGFSILPGLIAKLIFVSFLLSLISLVQATLIPWLYHVQWNVQCHPWKLRVHSYQEGPRKFSGYCGRRSWGGIWCPPRNLFLDSEAKERIHKTCFENWVSRLRKIDNFKIWTSWTIRENFPSKNVSLYSGTLPYGHPV